MEEGVSKILSYYVCGVSMITPFSPPIALKKVTVFLDTEWILLQKLYNFTFFLTPKHTFLYTCSYHSFEPTYFVQKFL